MEITEKFKFPLYAGGIFFVYFYYGILQEKITRTKYGEEKDTFHYSFALVFFQCIINAIYAKIMLSTILKQGADSTKTSHYATCSLTYLLAMVSSNKALEWVNYPTQVIGKSCKPIPVMILGVLIGNKSYLWKKYLFIFMIVAGVALFMYKPSGGASSSMEFGLGEILLVMSLTMDGITGAVQERMIAETKTKSGHMMLNMNIWSIGYVTFALIFTGEGFAFLEFIQKYPEVLINMFIFSLCSAIGQFFIFLLVSEFGPLSCSIVTTTRKFFTVLGSVVIFGNKLNTRQWFGTTLVFSGLTLDAAYGKPPKKSERNSKD